MRKTLWCLVVKGGKSSGDSVFVVLVLRVNSIVQLLSTLLDGLHLHLTPGRLVLLLYLLSGFGNQFLLLTIQFVLRYAERLEARVFASSFRRHLLTVVQHCFSVLFVVLKSCKERLRAAKLQGLPNLPSLSNASNTCSAFIVFLFFWLQTSLLSELIKCMNSVQQLRISSRLSFATRIEGT